MCSRTGLSSGRMNKSVSSWTVGSEANLQLASKRMQLVYHIYLSDILLQQQYRAHAVKSATLEAGSVVALERTQHYTVNISTVYLQNCTGQFITWTFMLAKRSDFVDCQRVSAS